MIEEIKQKLQVDMEVSVKNLQDHLTKLRTGRASASVLDGVKVDYYGNPTPVKQVGQISTPEARLLQIQPFDKNLIGNIEKAILAANLGLTPSNDGNFIRVPFPALTEDKRKDIVKDIKKFGEEAKIKIRNLRRDQNEVVKSAQKAKDISEDDSKNYQDQIQKVTDEFVKKVDEVVSAKEKEVLTV